MKDLLDLFTSREIIVVYITTIVACVLYFIISSLDKSFSKRKQKQNTRELKKLVEEVKEAEIVDSKAIEEVQDMDDMVYVEPVISKDKALINLEDLLNKEEPAKKKEEPILEPKVEPVMTEIKEDIKYTDITPNKSEAQLELQKLTEELEQAQTEENIDLTAYEEEQERDAIISIDELMEKTKKLYDADELSKYEDQGDEPISLKDLGLEEKDFTEEPVITNVIVDEPAKQEQMVIDNSNNLKVPSSNNKAYSNANNYKSSPIISPIYGIEKETTEDIELENTANYEKLDQEIKKTNEFLVTMKELQKNLE